MRYTWLLALLSILLVAMLSSAAGAWDVYYDGSVLPNDPSLGGTWHVPSGVDPSACTSDGDVLHIPASSMSYRTSLYAIPFGDPVTLEARFRLTSTIASRYAWLGAGTPSFMTSAALYADRVETRLYEGTVTHPADLTVFHTIRIATASASYSAVWLDGELVAEGRTAPGVQVGIWFGSDPGVDSYWDYVAYSKDYLPLPEPSSLSFLSLALAGVGIGAVRRRL